MAINTKINKNAAPTLELLKARFPAIFVDNEAEMRPLKIGIHKDLFDALGGEVTRMSIRGALALYTSAPSYKPVIKPGVPRIDLNGEVCGIVEEEYQENPPPNVQRRKSPMNKGRPKSRPHTDANTAAPAKRRGTVQHPARRVRARKQQEQTVTITQRPSRKINSPNNGTTAPHPVKVRTTTRVAPPPRNSSSPLLVDELKAAPHRPVIKLKKRRHFELPEEAEKNNSADEDLKD